MLTIAVAEEDHERIALLARAWEVDDTQAIHRLLEAFAGRSVLPEEDRSGSPDTVEADDQVQIHAIYMGVRVKGRFDPNTHAVTILDGVLAGRRFGSPSGAAIALVERINPLVAPNRNGWSFWRISDGGYSLRSLRHGGRE